MVVIRMSRGGRVHRPSYTIVAVDSRRSRDGAVLEKLGKYEAQPPPWQDPIQCKKRIHRQLDGQRGQTFFHCQNTIIQ